MRGSRRSGRSSGCTRRRWPTPATATATATGGCGARELLAVERHELLRLRDEGAISDVVMRRVQYELDLEELLLGDG